MSYNNPDDQDFQSSGINRSAGSQAFDKDVGSGNLDSGTNQSQGQYQSQGQWDGNQRQGRQNPTVVDQGYDKYEGSGDAQYARSGDAQYARSDDKYAQSGDQYTQPRSEDQYGRSQDLEGKRVRDAQSGEQRGQHDQGNQQKPTLTEKVKGTAEKLMGKSKGDSGTAQRGEQRQQTNNVARVPDDLALAILSSRSMEAHSTYPVLAPYLSKYPYSGGAVYQTYNDLLLAQRWSDLQVVELSLCGRCGFRGFRPESVAAACVVPCSLAEMLSMSWLQNAFDGFGNPPELYVAISSDDASTVYYKLNNLYRSVRLSRRDSVPAFDDLEPCPSPPFPDISPGLAERSAILKPPAPSVYMDGDAGGDKRALNMPDSHTSTPDTERISVRPSPPLVTGGSSPTYQHTPPFRHRASFVGPQYSMSHQQPPLNIMHSAPQFAYPPHLGIPGREASIPHMAYSSSPSMMPMLQPHAPLYQFQNQSPDGSITPQHSFATNLGPAPPLYALSDPSPPPVSPTQGHPGQAGTHPSTFSSPAPYSSMAYSSPHQYAYATPPSFAASPRVYPPQYASAPYPASYAPSGDQEGHGTWWYVPPPGHPNASSPYEGMQPSFHAPYNMGFRPVAHRHNEGYSSSRPSATPGPSSTSPRLPQPQPQTQPQAGLLGPGAVPGHRSPSSPGTSHNSPPPVEDSESAAPSATSDHARQLKRRPYHPNPPVQRSDWVMWAGNVPSDATHDELWRSTGGVSSIFLISRSNCAFVNFESQQHLEAATRHFNGQPLRPTDPRCPRLVCRIRRPTDDLRSGVGGQRGMGIHAKWVREQKQKAGKEPPNAGSPEEVAARIESLALSDDEGLRTGHEMASMSNSSGSFTSTNSAMLAQYFPQRYFILKSLTQVDLDISVQQGLWATQRHNEGILDQAYRTSQDVFLIFGVNKSGEFYGYARMTGPISRGEHSVDWPPITSPRSVHSQASAPDGAQGDHSASSSNVALGKRAQPPMFFDEGHMIDESPVPVSVARDRPPMVTQKHRSGQPFSAPPEPHQPHRKLTVNTPQIGYSLDRGIPPGLPRGFELDSKAPLQALKHKSEDVLGHTPTSDARKEHSAPVPVTSSLRPVQEVAESLQTPSPAPPPEQQQEGAVWGEAFPIQWIRTDRLPFNRTRRFRNPWNHGREVKVSRDGTELEPSVGKALLEEWNRPAPSPPTSPVGGSRPNPSHRGLRPSQQHPHS
ncbi:hypothetical protein EVG20_g5272 [Dentipellis fragilis]|uniref:YTH domain-containing protein n=1 Tax=Dentipellis fragilis TaxID=205917 RepID=A0A4Y9YTD6_9AGAM|nr:hypothetical protein EVG20_g5272 [Dentipellis fragilis]